MNTELNTKNSGLKTEIVALGIIGICAVLVISPIDALPDMVPIVGFVDDFCYIAIALAGTYALVKKLISGNISLKDAKAMLN